MTLYHYCALYSMEVGKTAYASGCFLLEEDFDLKERYVEFLGMIAATIGWPTDQVVLISLNRV